MPLDWKEEPFNFSWAIPGLLAGCGFPSERHLRWLQEEGVDHLVTLNAERAPPVAAFREHESNESCLEWTRISIVDFSPPTVDQIETVMDIIEKSRLTNKKVCIHCTMGRGRTGSMIACWLIKSQGMDGQTAIRETRKLRPGSIETKGQEEAIINYALSIR